MNDDKYKRLSGGSSGDVTNGGFFVSGRLFLVQFFIANILVLCYNVFY